MGGDESFVKLCKICKSFNPRPRVGGDAIMRKGTRYGSKVSIHAPAWGATAKVWEESGVDKFQSTPPRGGRPRQLLALHGSLQGFNPRPRVGGDAILPDLLRRPRVSIHAPAWGATVRTWPSRFDEHVSIHAPAWGATTMRLTVTGWQRVSIHAPAWGATLTLEAHPLPVKVSIHAPAWGATRTVGGISWCE